MYSPHGEGERMNAHETPAETEAQELKSSAEVQDAIRDVGGHNLLSEHGFLEESSAEKGKWMETVQSEVIDAHGLALVIRQAGKTVGFVLINPEGIVKQFRSVEGKESEVLTRSLKKIKEKGFEHPTAHLTEKSEHMRSILLAAGFHDKEKTEEGKIVMEEE